MPISRKCWMRVKDIFLIWPSSTYCTENNACGFFDAQMTSKLFMRRVGDIGHGAHRPAILRAHIEKALVIDRADHLPVTQICRDLSFPHCWNTKGYADTRPAPVEPHDQPGAFGRSPVMARVHTERPVIAGKARPDGLFKHEAGVPHQRGVAENPKIATCAVQAKHPDRATPWLEASHHAVKRRAKHKIFPPH